ncbi:MAG: ATP-grasp domain-containing protein [Thermoanaerobaculia bacterium]|nr:MAG: ATP-grasp domain-containing protein [Thermoanaerobaculia bacterium]MBZ0103264.1 ATP-grasp domain-containing protein [Thermoanaerobaculia bacterium]
MKRLRVLMLVHAHLIPPAEATAEAALEAPWRTEFDVARCLEALGHRVEIVGVADDLEPIRRAVRDSPPDVAFNLIECFDDVAHFDQNVVAYLELQKIRYTGCNARGLMLARDKAVAKKLLSYHRIRVADFAVAPRGRRFRRPRQLQFPLFVKSLALDSSIGISQASVVDSEEKLYERIRFVHESCGTDALVESYIEGRELYVGVIGNDRLTALPVWELFFEQMPEGSHKIATERTKWNAEYQERHGIMIGPAEDLPEGMEARLQRLAKRVFRVLYLNGYARIDMRLTADGQPCIIEANPNPQIAHGEEFAESAHQAGLDYPALVSRLLRLALAWEPARAG